MSKEARIGFRASAELRALVERYGDVSDAAQALILIGAATLGADLADLRFDLTMLTRQQVAPVVQEQLYTMLNTSFNTTLNNSFNIYDAPDREVPTLAGLGFAEAEEDTDPLGSLGIDV